jgi:hypothetical protein
MSLFQGFIPVSREGFGGSNPNSSILRLKPKTINLWHISCLIELAGADFSFRKAGPGFGAQRDLIQARERSLTIRFRFFRRNTSRSRCRASCSSRFDLPLTSGCSLSQFDWNSTASSTHPFTITRRKT